jgi:hypothetical protein
MKTLGAIIDRAIKSAVETGRDQHLLANGDHVSFVSGDDLLDAEGDYIGVVSEGGLFIGCVGVQPPFEIALKRYAE